MTDTLHRLLLWMAVMSILSFFMFGWDKLMAVKQCSRIPEAALLGISLCGGAAGSLLGMLLFRHKIRKAPFPVLVPLFLLLHAGILIWTLYQ